MTYFTEISGYQTYANSDADFHFSYNANSGGGQSFLGGMFIDENGELTSPTLLDGLVGIFNYVLKNENGQERDILLDDNKGKYEIKPRGLGSTSMKLGVGTKMQSPSKLISTFFMLPPTCAIKNPINLDVSILSSNNYWLQSMWLKCTINDSSKQVNLIPIDFVYCGGSNKEKKGNDRFFKLDAKKRIIDIISLSKNAQHLPEKIGEYINVFSSIYLGETTFNYDLCVETTKHIMISLANYFPDKYSGIEDPLPLLMSLITESTQQAVNRETLILPLQQIFYGAPGSGKSHRIKEIIQENGIDEKEQVIRTTFHPDSDYSTFVGCYKPIMKSVPQTYVVEGKEKPVINSGTNLQSAKDEIVYDYTPQAFVQAYTKAWITDKTIILVIEEINRGNCAQIFGDIFQLLDRGDDGVSDYEIKPDKALEDYLKSYFARFGEAEIPEQIRTGEIMKLPANLSIWATMNTSDQSLFPIDSAFKRRWEWKYTKIVWPYRKNDDGAFKLNENGEKIHFNYTIEGGHDWWEFLLKINAIIDKMTNSADKQLGYFFAKAKDNIISYDTFVSKVCFYLWNDIFKTYALDEQQSDLFSYTNTEGQKAQLTFPAFYDGDGNVIKEVAEAFIGNVLNWNQQNGN